MRNAWVVVGFMWMGCGSGNVMDTLTTCSPEKPCTAGFSCNDRDGTCQRTELFVAHTEIVDKPAKVSSETNAMFTFRGTPNTSRFECRFDPHDKFTACSSPFAKTVPA